LERFILNEVHRFAGGVLRHRLVTSYPEAHRSIINELAECDRLSKDRKDSIQTSYDGYLREMEKCSKEYAQIAARLEILDKMGSELDGIWTSSLVNTNANLFTKIMVFDPSDGIHQRLR